MRGRVAGEGLLQGGLHLPAGREVPHTTSALHCREEIGAEVFGELRRVMPSLLPGWVAVDRGQGPDNTNTAKLAWAVTTCQHFPKTSFDESVLALLGTTYHVWW